jgi:tetratricopeptide (TPR) repeat protein
MKFEFSNNKKMKTLKLYIITISFILINISAFAQSQDFNEIYALSDAAFHYKNYEQAKIFYSKAIVLKPNMAELYIKRGNSNYEEKMFDAAILDYKTALSLNNSTANYKISQCYAQTGNAAKACEYLELYLKSSDKITESEIKLNEAFSNIKNTKEWNKLWKNEYYSSFEKTYSEVLYQSSRNNDVEALEIIEEYLNKNSKKHEALELRGDILMKLKDYKNAEKTYSSALKLKPNNSEYILKAGNANFELGNFNKALEYYVKYSEIEQYNIEIKYKIAETEYQLKNYENASKNIDLYLKYYPSETDAIFLSSKIKYENNDLFPALEQINLCLKNNDSAPNYYVLRGDIYMKTQTFQNASDDYSMALDLNPKQAEVYFKRGISKTKIHDNVGACSDFKKAEQMGFYKASNFTSEYCND